MQGMLGEHRTRPHRDNGAMNAQSLLTAVAGEIVYMQGGLIRGGGLRWEKEGEP